MPSTIISVLASALFVAATVASPIAEAGNPTPQINAGCNGRIINLFSFTSNNCINNDTSATPFFNNQKIVARTGTISGCLRVNTPNFQAGSFVYTSDGVEGKCSLQTYQTEDCSDDFDRSIKVNADVSGCVSTSFQAVKLKC